MDLLKVSSVDKGGGVKYKKNKRSKSETLMTLNSLWAKGAYGIGHLTHRSPSKRSNSNSSNHNFNQIIDKQKPMLMNKTNNFLDVNSRSNNYLDTGDHSNNNNNNGQRRFSLRNFFFKPKPPSAKSSQSHLSHQRNSEPENYLLQLIQQNQSANGAVNNPQLQYQIPPKIINSCCSVSNSSSMTSTASNNASFKLLPVSSVTGSVLKFHKSKLGSRNLETSSPKHQSDVSSTRTLSDPNVNKVPRTSQTQQNSLRLPANNDYK